MTRTFESGPARRAATLITAGFVGPSGSGKTKSMLRFADGMRRVKPGPTFLVDSNLRRSLHHAEDHDFNVVHITPPFDPDSWRAAFKRCVDEGAARVIVDSMSDEWEGEGGVLDAHDSKLDKMVERKLKKDPQADEWKAREQLSDTAWIEVKQAHRNLRLWMWQQPVDWLLGYRAKEKTERKKTSGKTERVEMGWQPIGASDVIYDLLFKCLLPPMGDGRPVWSPSEPAEKLLVKQPGWFREMFAAHPQIDEELGELIGRWAAGAATGPVQPGIVERFDACKTPEDYKLVDMDARAVWLRMSPADQESVNAAIRRARDRGLVPRAK